MKRWAQGFSKLVLSLAIATTVSLPVRANADVRFDGAWPETDKNVALEAEAIPRAQALKRLADAAGWSLVTDDAPTSVIDLHVKNQPPRKVLSILLAEGHYVAARDGDLVSIRREESTTAPSALPIPSVTPSPGIVPPVPVPPMPAPAGKRAEDRTVTGGHLRLEASETAHDVTVYGGKLEVLGTVTGDVSVFGGSVRVAKGGHVFGNATVLGGALRMDDGAKIDGDVGILGGSLKRAENATIGGTVSHAGDDDGESSSHVSNTAEAASKPKGSFATFVGELGSAISKAALLFVFGCVLLALASRRIETLQVEVASRPMRSFALGLVGLVGATALVIALCVTIVGIPAAITAVLVGAVAAYAGVAAVLTTAGEALFRRQTQNPYVHLAVGCALLLVLGAIPLVGPIVKVAIALVGIGVVIATRGAGLFAGRAADGPA